MNDTEKYEALAVRYRRLRIAAQAVLDCVDYPTEGGDEPKVYRRQLAALRRELDGEPQPSAMAWMSVS